MNLTRVLLYGGSYREEWDDNYRLTIQYEGQQELKMCFRDGSWQPENGVLPTLPFAEIYFPQAASAAVAAERFVASGQMEPDLSRLAPDGCRGAVFTAECMRLLLDNSGMRLEQAYPYIASLFEKLTPEEEEMLFRIQPRTEGLLKLLDEMMKSNPPAMHDLRLSKFRSPFGAVRAGETVTLRVSTPKNGFRSCTMELFGDESSSELPMEPEAGAWYVKFPAPEREGAYWYRFRLERDTDDQSRWLCAAPDGIHGQVQEEAGAAFRFTVFSPDFETPEWFQHAILYQVFPDRFACSGDDTAKRGIEYHRALGQTPELHMNRSEEPRWKPRAFEKDYIPDDFYGGTLNGIRNKLPDLRELGVTALYLNPIFESRSNHRYDTSDYLKIDPILGTNEEFERLCQEAERFGIRIICDGVFSHTGADSVYFNRDGHYPGVGACQVQESPYDSWYDFRHFPDEYRSWWGFHELPEVNENDPGWRSFVVTGENSVVRQWLRRGASGWRLDVADELPDEVLCLIREAAKEEKTDSLILGEVWEDAILKESYGARRRYALGGALDSVMNYPFRTAVLDFLHDRNTAYDLANFLTGQQLHYPEPMYRSLMNLLGTHDVERLVTNLALDVPLKDLTRERQLELEAEIPADNWPRARRLACLAAAIQFSIPGVPSIYYGDEILMTGVNDPFNRRPMAEVREKSPESLFREYIRCLAHFRKEQTALQEGDAFFLATDPDVLTVIRTAGKETVLTVVNRAAETRRYAAEWKGFSAAGEIGAYSAMVFRNGSLQISSEKFIKE